MNKLKQQDSRLDLRPDFSTKELVTSRVANARQNYKEAKYVEANNAFWEAQAQRIAEVHAIS